MKLGELFANGVPADAANLDITGLTLDSRRVEPGFLFAALQGVAQHGRDYVEDAQKRGAAAILSAGDLHGDPGLPHVVSDEARWDFAKAASLFYPRWPEPLEVGRDDTPHPSAQTVITTLPRTWPPSTRRCASADSASGNTFSMATVISPDAVSSPSQDSCSLLGFTNTY